LSSIRIPIAVLWFVPMRIVFVVLGLLFGVYLLMGAFAPG